MAPVNPNTASRIKLHYTAPTFNHDMLFHGLLGVSQSDLKAAVSGIATLMAKKMYTGMSFDTAQYAAEGSNLFNPLTWTPVNASSGISYTAATNPSSNFLQWGGRSPSSGVRVKLYLLQCIPLVNNHMRLSAGDDSDLDDIIDGLQAADTFIGNVAGEAVVWKTYTNAGQNDYITHKARS